MKYKILFLLALLLTTLGLSACVKNQEVNNSGNTATAPTDTSTINNTNYQDMMREQSTRAADASVDVPHVGGRR